MPVEQTAAGKARTRGTRYSGSYLRELRRYSRGDTADAYASFSCRQLRLQAGESTAVVEGAASAPTPSTDRDREPPSAG